MADEESDIVINGIYLTPAQSMTVRVAINSFGMSLQAEGLGDDETGKSITKGYLARICELNKIFMEK